MVIEQSQPREGELAAYRMPLVLGWCCYCIESTAIARTGYVNGPDTKEGRTKQMAPGYLVAIDSPLASTEAKRGGWGDEDGLVKAARGC